MDGDNIVVRQRSLEFGRGLGIEGALNCGLTQSGFVCDLASDALGLPRPARGYWFILHQYRRSGLRFQQFRIAPDMFVPLLFGQVELVFELLKFAAKSHQVL